MPLSVTPLVAVLMQVLPDRTKSKDRTSKWHPIISKHLYTTKLFVCLLRVIFKIKSSKQSNNGTDVGSGQIPEILYQIPEVEKDTGFSFWTEASQLQSQLYVHSTLP